MTTTHNGSTLLSEQNRPTVGRIEQLTESQRVARARHGGRDEVTWGGPMPVRDTPPDEFAAEMRECSGSDEEVAHGMMDDIMCRVLRELGYGDGVDVFDKQDKRRQHE